MSFIDQLKRSLLQRKELTGIPRFEKIPAAVTTSEEYLRLREQIALKHAAYIREVSSPEMAMSLELAHFLLGWCLWKQPKHLLDLGSGFSSYVFRLYRELVGDAIIVYSVDDHAAWLEKTRHYLENAGLNTEHLYLLTELQGQQTDGYFDLVLLDLNFVEVRKDYIDYTARILAADGAVIVDDVHKVEFLREVKRIARMAGCRLYDIRKATYDGFGRFSIVMKR